MFKKNKEKKKNKPEHKHSVEHTKEEIKDLEKRASSRYQKVRSFFKETYNKRIMYMYIVCAIGVTFLIEVLANQGTILCDFITICFPSKRLDCSNDTFCNAFDEKKIFWFSAN